MLSCCAEQRVPTKQARIVEVQESNAGGCFAVQCSSGNLPAQVGAEVVHEELGVACHHQPAMTMQASDLACSSAATLAECNPNLPLLEPAMPLCRKNRILLSMPLFGQHADVRDPQSQIAKVLSGAKKSV